MDDPLAYDALVEDALRGVVREALSHVARHGLPAGHHFYITYRTDHPGVALADSLRAEHSHEMTIVLQHRFWDLEVADDRFAVGLSFASVPHRLEIPFAAVTVFADPEAEFALRFRAPAETKSEPEGGEVVTLDRFRKK